MFLIKTYYNNDSNGKLDISTADKTISIGLLLISWKLNIQQYIFINTSIFNCIYKKRNINYLEIENEQHLNVNIIVGILYLILILLRESNHANYIRDCWIAIVANVASARHCLFLIIFTIMFRLNYDNIFFRNDFSDSVPFLFFPNSNDSMNWLRSICIPFSVFLNFYFRLNFWLNINMITILINICLRSFRLSL